MLKNENASFLDLTLQNIKSNVQEENHLKCMFLKVHRKKITSWLQDFVLKQIWGKLILCAFPITTIYSLFDYITKLSILNQLILIIVLFSPVIFCYFLIRSIKIDIESIKQLQNSLEEWENLGVIPDQIGRHNLNKLIPQKSAEILLLIPKEYEKDFNKDCFEEHDKYRLRNDIFALTHDQEYFRVYSNLKRLIIKMIKEL